jgi:hypothetical protein
MPEFRTITIGYAAEDALMHKAQKPAGYVDEFDLDQVDGNGNGLYATLWRHGGDSPSGERRIALFRDPSEELQLIRGRVAMLEKYESEFLRLIREAEAERDFLKEQNARFVDLLETSSNFLYDWGRRDGLAHAEEINAVLQEAKAEVVHGDPTDNVVLIDYLESKIVGKTISVDVSTCDHDAGNRIFCTVAELMREGDSFSILAEDPKPNYSAAEELLQVEAQRDATNAQVLQLQLAIRRFISTYGISVDGSSARNSALIVLASFAPSGDGEPLTSLLAEGHVSAAEPEQAKAEVADLLGLQIRLLDWNRAHAEPPIKPGYEYGVAAAVFEQLMPADTQLGRVLRQVVTSALGAGSDVPST